MVAAPSAASPSTAHDARIGSDVEAAWAGPVEELRGVSPTRRAAYWRLYALARELALATRQREFPYLDDDDALDVVARLFERQLDAVLRAERPRSYVRASIRFGLRSAGRRRRGTEELEDVLAVLRVGSEEDAVLSLDLRRACVALRARERDVLGLVAAGFDRHEIGERLGVSRAAVDQIVSRARRKGGLGAAR